MYYDELRNIINELRPQKNSVAKFITMQNHAKGRPPLERDMHDIVMAYCDITVLALLVIRELKGRGVEYKTVERNLTKVLRGHPRLLKWLWDNEDYYFCRITKSDLTYKGCEDDEEDENIQEK